MRDKCLVWLGRYTADDRSTSGEQALDGSNGAPVWRWSSVSGFLFLCARGLLLWIVVPVTAIAWVLGWPYWHHKRVGISQILGWADLTWRLDRCTASSGQWSRILRLGALWTKPERSRTGWDSATRSDVLSARTCRYRASWSPPVGLGLGRPGTTATRTPRMARPLVVLYPVLLVLSIPMLVWLLAASSNVLFEGWLIVAWTVAVSFTARAWWQNRRRPN